MLFHSFIHSSFMCVGAYVPWCFWRSADNLGSQLLLCFYNVGPVNQNQVVRLGNRHIYLLSPYNNIFSQLNQHRTYSMEWYWEDREVVNKHVLEGYNATLVISLGQLVLPANHSHSCRNLFFYILYTSEKSCTISEKFKTRLSFVCCEVTGDLFFFYSL